MNCLQTTPNPMNYGWEEGNDKFVPVWHEVKVLPTPEEVKVLK